MIGPREMEGIQPFDLSAAVSPQEIDLVNVIVEEFRVPRKFARPQAVSLIEQYETSHVLSTSQGVPGMFVSTCRSVK